MIGRLWAKLYRTFAKPAPPSPEAANVSSPGAIASVPAGSTVVSRRLFELAEAGDVDAQAALGEHFFDDREENYAACHHWNERAALAGHIGAQGRLATIYHEGLGVERNPEKAFQWWYSAARQNHHGAQLMVAVAYENGTVVKADLMESAYWASLSYRNSRDGTGGRAWTTAYYRSVLNKLTEEQKLQLLARLQRQVKQD